MPSQYYADERFALWHGDALDTLRGLPDNSVNTCLTSPPYWALRDYGTKHQLGQEATPRLYVERLQRIFAEVRRVLTERGTLWLNIGDTYYGNGHRRSENIEEWQRAKQLCLIPFRLAAALEDDGWLLRNTVVWHKPNAQPSSATDRLTNHWEPIFLFAKSARYFFNLDAVRVPTKTSGEMERTRAASGPNRASKSGARRDLRRWVSSPRHRMNIDGLKTVLRRPDAPAAVELAAYLGAALATSGKRIQDVADALGCGYERARHYFRTDKIGARLPPPETWCQLKDLLGLDDRYDAAMRVHVGDNAFRNHPLGRNPGDMISMPLAPFRGAHFAVMPMELPLRLLRATLPQGGVCLDPFNGAGTTGAATLALGGTYIGIDVVREYLALTRDRLVGVRSQSKPPSTVSLLGAGSDGGATRPAHAEVRSG